MTSDKKGNIFLETGEKSEREQVFETAWRSVFRWLYAVTGVLFVFFFVWIALFQVVEVAGDSMEPTLKNGSRVVVGVLGYKPAQGDVVVIASSDKSQPLIKRIVALEGQSVSVDYAAGTVSVDGKALGEEYLAYPMNEPRTNELVYPYVVPDGCVFVMGDNRNDSYDSRSVEIKAVDENYILGRVVMRFSAGQELFL